MYMLGKGGGREVVGGRRRGVPRYAGWSRAGLEIAPKEKKGRLGLRVLFFRGERVSRGRKERGLAGDLYSCQRDGGGGVKVQSILGLGRRGVKARAGLCSVL